MMDHLLQKVGRKAWAVFGTGLVLAGGFMLLPTSTAMANHNTCDCDGTQCAGSFERLCCSKTSEECGCTFFTSCP